MESYIIPTHLHTGQWFFTAGREEESEKSGTLAQAIVMFWSLAAGMIQKLMRVSLKSTVFPASPQSFWEADSLFIHCFFFFLFLDF